MELPSATPAQIRDSDAQLNERERQRELPPMLTATQGRSRSLGAACGAAHSAKIILESGDVRTLPIVDTILQLPMDLAPGYHRLYLDDHQTTDRKSTRLNSSH